MKKFVFLLFLLTSLGGFFIIQQDESTRTQLKSSQSISPVEKIELTSLFIPNWTLEYKKNWEKYNTLIYFSIPLTENGLETNQSNLESFTSSAPQNSEKLLTISMLNHDTNQKILEDKSIQQKGVNDSIEIAKKYGFDGIVIDFESKSISFSSVTDRNTNFLVNSIELIKSNNLKAYSTLFGDTYFRARAYDVKKIAKASDGILIMAYDFTKSGGGRPGPNFPISGKERYGYDFNQMLEDFTQDADPDKITVIFGMFGYDWEIDKDDNAVGTGQAVTTSEFEASKFPGCKSSECITARMMDEDSRYRITRYTDDSDNFHEVWSETEESVAKKIEITKKFGISKIGYWANSFF